MSKATDVFQASRSVTKTSKNSDNTRVASIRGSTALISISEPSRTRRRKQAIDGMGYQILSAATSSSTATGAPDGRNHAESEYALTLDDVGRLDLQFSISGYTLEFIKGLQQMQEQMASQSDDAKAQQAMGLAMMGMMQQLTFNSLSLRFDDASLTNKVLDMVAEPAGHEPRPDGPGPAGHAAAGAGAQLQNPEFQQAGHGGRQPLPVGSEEHRDQRKAEAPLPFASLAGSAMGAAACSTLPVR